MVAPACHPNSSRKHKIRESWSRMASAKTKQQTNKQTKNPAKPYLQNNQSKKGRRQSPGFKLSTTTKRKKKKKRIKLLGDTAACVTLSPKCK
jgi:hypothetical protein